MFEWCVRALYSSRSTMNWNAGHAGVVERHVIGRHDRARPDDRDAEVVQRRHPRFEDRPRRHVALQPDAANLAAAVVGVEVGGDLRLLRLQRHRLDVGDVLADVGARAEQPLLLAAPQADPDRPARLGADRLQNPQRLHHRAAAGRVVGGAGRVGVRVEVRAEQDDFRRQVAAGNFGDRIEPVRRRSHRRTSSRR